MHFERVNEEKTPLFTTESEINAHCLAMQPRIIGIALYWHRATAKQFDLHNLVSTAFDAAWHAAKTFAAGWGSVEAWTLRVVRQRIRQYVGGEFRRRKALAAAGVRVVTIHTKAWQGYRDHLTVDDHRLVAKEYDPKRAAAEELAPEILKVARRVLSSPRLEVFLMHWVEGRSQRSIAKARGTTVQNVNMMLLRSYEQIREAAKDAVEFRDVGDHFSGDPGRYLRNQRRAAARPVKKSTRRKDAA